MSDKSKEIMEVLMVFVLLLTVLSTEVPSVVTPSRTRETMQELEPVTLPVSRTASTEVVISGVSLDSGSEALIDYFADGVWREEQDTLFDKVDISFTPFVIDSLPIITTDF